MNDVDPFVAALINLCKNRGGPDMVADEAKVSAANLLQIINGTKLPSGRPRGVGPRLRAKLTAAYPGWHESAINSVVNENASPLLNLTQTLEMLEGSLYTLAPMLQDAGRSALTKWMQGQATTLETAATLAALIQASVSLPKAGAPAQQGNLTLASITSPPEDDAIFTLGIDGAKTTKEGARGSNKNKLSSEQRNRAGFRKAS